MNTNALKKFAQEARIKLLNQVAAKLEYVLNTDTAALREKSAQIKKLQEAITSSSKEQVIDKVTYTWFNRLMALRFMDANDFQPIGIRVLSPKDGYTLPELLDEARQGNIPEEFKVNRKRVMDLLDGKIPSTNPQNEAYKELLIAACNNLNQVFPFLFERINDYTELLLPDDLTSELSIVQDVRDGMSIEDCAEVEIIGWLYQFYISEKKDEVFASNAAVKKEDIPAATQLFTPRWIVEFMVQNTVGKLWLQNKPNSKLRKHMPYFIESPSVTADDYLKIGSVEEIKLLDQALGSGHILVYGFELLYKIYEEEGYNPNEIPELIITTNLYGFEIDERAAQLAGMALMLKARTYQRRFFKKEVKPNIFCFNDLPLTNANIKESFVQIGYPLSDALLYDFTQMQQATNYGSLIAPHAAIHELEKAYTTIKAKENTADAFLKYQLEQLKNAIEQLLLLDQKFHCVVDNPPYMGGGNMNKVLGDFVKKNYPDSKADLMACFMEAGINMLHPKGFLGMINQHSWMFLSSYEKLREKLIDNIQFDNLLHLGPRTFPEIGGEVVQNACFTFVNKQTQNNAAFIRLVDFGNSDLKRTKTLEAIQNPDCGWFYTANQKDFEKIPGSPIGYWLSDSLVSSFLDGVAIRDISVPRQGMATTNNNYFLRFWHEVIHPKVNFNAVSQEDAVLSGAKWFPYNKGGEFRKWYGNNEYVVNFENNGQIICDFIDKSTTSRVGSNGRVINRDKYFKLCITWSALSSANISLRMNDTGFIFNTNGASIFLSDENLLFELMSFLNSKVAYEIIKVLSPTLNINPGDIANIPFKSNHNFDVAFARQSRLISREDWDSMELSWDFNKNELIRIKGQDLEETYDLYQQYWKNKFFQLHKNEEELNRQFIEIYGLQEELAPDVPLEDITILKEETSIENGQLVFHADEVFAQFMSYAAGCMFGRYSLDKEGLILADKGETLEDYLTNVGLSNDKLRFVPDSDNIMPVLDDEWFEDDIVGRFYAFLKASFGATNFEKNLAFVEECLGKDVRKYFVKDFYADHIRRYKKRPIYWMFSSPKGSFNVLIWILRSKFTTITVQSLPPDYGLKFTIHYAPKFTSDYAPKFTSHYGAKFTTNLVLL